VVTTPHPSRVIADSLLTTSELIHSRHPVLATLPEPATIPVLLHNLPLKSRASSYLHIATRPDIAVGLRRVLVGVKRHRTGEIPVAELGNGANDVDAVAVLGADLDGEGEGDACGVGACGRSVCHGDVEGCGCFAVAGGVDVVRVHEGVDGAVVREVGGRVGDVVGLCGQDGLGGDAIAGEGIVSLRMRSGGYLGENRGRT